MSKQDRQGVRTPADIERKYNLGKMRETLLLLTEKVSEFEKQSQTWFGWGIPTLGNYPADLWDTDALKNSHVGDIYYDNDTGSLYLFRETDKAYEWVACAGGGGIVVTSGGASATLSLAPNLKGAVDVEPSGTVEIIG